MLTADHIDEIVCSVMGVSLCALHSPSQKREICEARNMAMLKCKDWLHWGTVKTRRHYNKDSHTTILSDLKRAKSRIVKIGTYRVQSMEIDCRIVALIDNLKNNKQRIDMHYRLRKKGFQVIVKDKTVSLPISQREELENSRTMKLLKKHGYEIQYSIF